MDARAALFSATASFLNPPDFADALAYLTTKMTHKLSMLDLKSSILLGCFLIVDIK